MPAVTTAFANLLSTQFQSFLVNVGKETPRLWPMWLAEDDMEVNPSIYAKISGMGIQQIKPEGQQFAPDLPIEGPTFQVTATPYGMLFSVTWEMWRDDKYGVMGEMWGDMGRSNRFRQEVQGFGPWNNSFSTAVGYDGLSLCNTAHPDLDGTTQANRPTPDVTISQTAYQAAMVAFDLLNDERSRPMNMTGRRILGHPSNRYLFRELFGSDGEINTSDNNLNSVLGDNMYWGVSRYLTRTQDWWVMADMSDCDIQFLWRDRPRTRTFDDPFIEAADTTVYQRFAIRVGDWRGVYGSSVGF